MRYRRPLRRRSAAIYSIGHATASKQRRGIPLMLLFALALLCLFLAAVAVFLKDLSSQIAVSDASDIVTVQINNAIADIMAEQDYSGDYFVSFEKNTSGEVTAISSNMARINALSAKILHRVVGATENRTIEIGIPAGNLTGISLLMGRGPNIPVQIIVLTSSRVEFNNSIVTAGINQTKHQINLEVIVDIDILVPWGTENAQVVTEILIADTIVVGQVPNTYLNVQ
ncbi:MAG: sporulation protein YunB [Candidatus Limivicinus sp.]